MIILLLNLVTGVGRTVIYLLSRSLWGILQADIKINCFTRERNSVRRLELWCRMRKKEENCLSWGILSGERREERSSDFTDQLSAGVGRLTLHYYSALLWSHFNNECNVPSRPAQQGTTLSLVLEVTQLFILFLQIGCWKPEILYVRSFRHPLKLSDRKHIFSK